MKRKNVGKDQGNNPIFEVKIVLAFFKFSNLTRLMTALMCFFTLKCNNYQWLINLKSIKLPVFIDSNGKQLPTLTGSWWTHQLAKSGVATIHLPSGLPFLLSLSAHCYQIKTVLIVDSAMKYSWISQLSPLKNKRIESLNGETTWPSDKRRD